MSIGLILCALTKFILFHFNGNFQVIELNNINKGHNWIELNAKINAILPKGVLVEEFNLY